MRAGRWGTRVAPLFHRLSHEGIAWAAILLTVFLMMGAVPTGLIRGPPLTPSRASPSIGTETRSPTSGNAAPSENSPAYSWQTLNSSPELPNDTLWAAGYDPALGKIVALSEGRYQYSQTQVITHHADNYSSQFFWNCSFTPTNSTWAFGGGHWAQLHVAGPSPGLYRSLAYDPSSGSLIEFQATGSLLPNSSSAVTCFAFQYNIFGFASPGDLAPSTEFYSGILPSQQPETWEFRGGNWTRISTPSPLNAFTNIVYDPALSAVVMFTTINNVSNQLDLWEFDGGNWINAGATAFPSRQVGLNLSNALPNASLRLNTSCLTNSFQGCNSFVLGYGGSLASNLIYDSQLHELVWLYNNWVIGFNGTWHLISQATADNYNFFDPAYDPAVPGLVGEPCLDLQAQFANGLFQGCWNGTGVYSDGNLTLLNDSPPAPLPDVKTGYHFGGYPEVGNMFIFYGSWYSPSSTALMVFDPRDGYLVMFGATILLPNWTDHTYTYYISDQTYIFGSTAQLQISVSVSPSTICSSVSNACGTAQTAAQVSVSLALLPLNANAPLPTPRTDFVAYGPLFWVPAPQLSYLPGPNIRLVPSAAATSLCANLSGPVSPCPSAPRIESNGSGPPLYLWYWGNGSPPLEVGSTWTVTFTITSTLAANATLPIDRCASAYCGPSDGPQDGQLSGVASRPGSDAGSIPYSWPISLLDVLDPNATHPQPPPNPGPTTVPPSPPPPPIPTSPVSLPAPPTLLPSLIGSVAPGLSYIALAAGVMAAGFTRGRLRHPTPQRALAMALRSGRSPPRVPPAG